MQAVDPAFAGFDAVRGIVLLDAAFGIVDIFADQVDTAVFIQHLRRTEPHAGHVDTHRALHAAASRRLHAAPVLERIAHQQVGRQRNDRIVEIADFHRRERHLDHRAVGPVFGNRNPVPHLEHVVGRKLDAGDESQNAVAENQHDDRRRRSQTGQQTGGRLIDQDRNDQYAADQRRNALPGLPEPLDRLVLPCGTRRSDLENRKEHGIDKAEYRHNDIDLDQPRHYRPGFGLLFENHRQNDPQHDGADDVAQTAQHVGVEQIVVPRGFGALDDAPHAAHEDRTAHEVEERHRQQYQRKGHPAVPAAVLRGRESQPFEQGVGPMFQECLHTAFLSIIRPVREK